MILADPVTINKRLDGYEYISHPADLAFFENLVNQIRGMERPGDNVNAKLPGYTEPYAWRRTFELYCKMKTREAIPPDPVAQRREQNSHALESAWNFYLTDRTAVLELVRQGVLGEDQCQYLGLRPGDLAAPITPLDPNDKFSGQRHPDWHGRADRLRDAIPRWREMGVAEKASIPQVVTARRTDAAMQKMQRLITELHSRVSALEAKSTTTTMENAA